MRWALLALVACGDNHVVADAALADPATCTPKRGTHITMREVARFQDGVPVLVTAPAGDPRQYVVMRDGRILIIDHGAVRAEPFLDISADASGPVVAGGERGLLGLAFPPHYATTGTFYVYYTTLTQNLVARYQRRDADHADATGTVVLAIDDFASNHNGGMIDFGADGFLYIGTGDGGGGGDPQRTAGDPHRLLGKMLRIDVDQRLPGGEYGIPAGNPFADGVAGAPEVYHYGLRNPWRWSFDSATGDLWIGDVGQELFEEVDYLPTGSAAGADLGWSSFEGDTCFNEPCDPAGKLAPAVVHTHADGWCSVIGGQVYRGDCYPDLRGAYLYTDYCAHLLEAARVVGGRVRSAPLQVRLINTDGVTLDALPVTPSSLHADASGELYLTVVSCCGSSFIGAVYRLEAGLL